MPKTSIPATDEDVQSQQKIRVSIPIGDEDIVGTIFSPPKASDRLFPKPPSETNPNTAGDIQNILANITGFARPIVATGSGALGGAAILAATRNPWAIGTGVATSYSFADAFMQKLQKALGGEDPRSYLSEETGMEPGSFSETLMNSAQQAAITDLGGKAIGGAYRVAKPLTDKLWNRMSGTGPTILSSPNPYMDELPASLSQRTGSGTARLAEDITGGASKTEQLRAVGEASKKLGLRVSGNLKGKVLTDFEDPHSVAVNYSNNTKDALNNYTRASNAAAQNTLNIAEDNVLYYAGKKVEGPVNFTDPVTWAYNQLNKLSETYGQKSTGELLKVVSDDKKPLIEVANQIMRYARRDRVGNVILDAAGNVAAKPVPFRAAWDLKQAANKLAYKGDPIVLPHSRAQVADVGSSIDESIENSIATWQKDAKNALNSYRNSKTLVQNRKDLFESGDAITGLMKTPTSGSAQLDEVLKDPITTSRAIWSGSIERKELASYQLQKLLREAWDEKNKIFDGRKLLDSWFDPSKKAVLEKLYNVEQRADITNILRAIDATNQKVSAAGRIATAIRVGSAGVYLGGGLLSSAAMSSGHAQAGAIVGGVIGIAAFTKKVMLNPKAAKIAAYIIQNPNSPQIQYMSRQLFNSLNGTRILMKDAYGQQIPAEFDNGKVVPLE